MLKRLREQWEAGMTTSTLIVGILVPYTFMVEREDFSDVFGFEDESEANIELTLKHAFTIVASLCTAVTLASSAVGYMMSVFATCINSTQDVVWFFIEMPIALPNRLNVIGLGLFCVLLAIGMLLSQGLTVVGFACSAIWLLTFYFCFGLYYTKAQRYHAWINHQQQTGIDVTNEDLEAVRKLFSAAKPQKSMLQKSIFRAVHANMRIHATRTRETEPQPPSPTSNVGRPHSYRHSSRCSPGETSPIPKPLPGRQAPTRYSHGHFTPTSDYISTAHEAEQTKRDLLVAVSGERAQARHTSAQR